MQHLFKNITRLSLTFVFTLIMTTISWSQITEVKYRLDYNASLNQYDCFLIVVEGCTNNFVHRVQANSQISIVAPRSAMSSVADDFNPITNNGQPMKWSRQNVVGNPDPSIDESYHSMVPSLNPTATYTSLCEGDEVLLFRINLANIECEEEVRLWKNGEDPDTQTLAGANFNNGFTVGGIANIYSGNVDPLTTPVSATPNEIVLCSGACTELAVSTCLYSTYEWSTGETTSSITVCPSMLTNYSVNLTDFDNNMSTENYEVAIAAPLPDLDYNVSVATVCEDVNFAIWPPLEDPLALIPLDQNIVEINEFGGFKPIAAGTTGFTLLNTETGCTKETDIAVTVNGAPEIEIPAEKEVCIGDVLQLSLVSTAPGTWTSNNAAVATVDNNGLVTAIGSGLGLIRYTNVGSGCQSNFIDITVRSQSDPLCTTSVIEDELENLVLYPNPTTDQFTIENIVNGSSVQVVDILGRNQLSKKSTSSSMLVSTADWNPGIYLVRVNNREKKKALKLHVVR